MISLIDTHSHIYDEAFDNYIVQVIDRAKEAGLTKIILPNVDLLSVDRLFALAEKDKMFYPLMGLHPTSVTKNVEQDLKKIKTFFDNYNIYGIGEIGLDFYWDREFEQEQIYAFEEQLKWSEEKNNMPIVIHCRKAFDTILASLKKNNRKQYKGIFHCFSGDKRQAQTLIDMGFYLGIGGVLTFKNAHVADIVRDFDLNNFVLETDSPYLAPVPFRGKRNESSYVRIVAEKIAEIKNIPLEKVAEITTINAEKVLSKTN